MRQLTTGQHASFGRERVGGGCVTRPPYGAGGALLKRNSRIVDAVLRLFDIMVLAAVLPVAHVLREALRGDGDAVVHSPQYYLPLFVVMAFCWFVSSWMFEVYDAYRTRPMSLEVSRIVRAMALCALAIGAGGYFAKQQDVPRLHVGLYVALASVLLVANRIALRKFARMVRRRGHNTRRFAVVGTGAL